jgi:isopenicillin-N epimerase
MSPSESVRPDWSEVRAQFELAPEFIHIGASQFIASHPRIVREAIELHRRALDSDPVQYVEDNEDVLMQRVREAVSEFVGADNPDDVALTDSTTMALGLLYSGLPLTSEHEIVVSDHEHYSHLEAVRGTAKRSGVKIRKCRLYDGSAANVSADELVQRVLDTISSRTRAVGVTWVHSDTGLKYPVAQLAQAMAALNSDRKPDDRVLLCVDGVHGIGIETETVATLGCDFLASGCHKWLFGPRGTGFLWGRGDMWPRMLRVIPSFTDAMDAYSEDDPLPRMSGREFTPGGFHTLEHRWAATEAFTFHKQVGRERVRDRVHALNRRCKERLAAMSHITLHTPMSDALSSGITAFEVRGMKSSDAEKRLRKEKIIATVAPYPSAYLRLTPGIINTPEEVDTALEAIERLGRA